MPIVTASVAPLVGAWIEIKSEIYKLLYVSVAPLVGAWIEMLNSQWAKKPATVAPLVGAWIEIMLFMSVSAQFLSLLSWERGLK